MCVCDNICHTKSQQSFKWNVFGSKQCTLYAYIPAAIPMYTKPAFYMGTKSSELNNLMPTAQSNPHASFCFAPYIQP